MQFQEVIEKSHYQKNKKTTTIDFNFLCARYFQTTSQILTEVGIRVTSKSHHTLSLFFLKPKDAIHFEQKRGLVYQISCWDCNAVHVGETGCGVRTRKREYVDAVMTFNTKKSALSQHVMNFDNRIHWDYVKVLK